jgi:hypothetical protein
MEANALFAQEFHFKIRPLISGKGHDQFNARSGCERVLTKPCTNSDMDLPGAKNAGQKTQPNLA